MRGKMDRGNNRSEPRARRGRPALARSPAAQQMPPSGSHGSEVAWIPPGPRLYDTAYVLFVCMYPPCPPGAFLLAMRASGMLPVDGSNRSPPVPGPQYLRRPVRQALAQSGTTLAARAAAAMPAAMTAAMPVAVQHRDGHARMHSTSANGGGGHTRMQSTRSDTHWLLPPEPFFHPSGSRFRVQDPDDGVYPSSLSTRTWNMLPVPLYRLQPRLLPAAVSTNRATVGPCCWCWSRTSITLKAGGV